MRATLFLATVTIAAAQTQLPPAASAKVDFEKDVQPILAQKCHSCHGDEVQQSGLRLDKRLPAQSDRVFDVRALYKVAEEDKRLCTLAAFRRGSQKLVCVGSGPVTWKS